MNLQIQQNKLNNDFFHEQGTLRNEEKRAGKKSVALKKKFFAPSC